MTAFKIGCDIVQIDRIRASLAKKILSTNELEEFYALSNHRAIEYLAGHFAAKEAIFKTLDQTYFDFKEIEIAYDTKRQPYGIVQGQIISISISHEKEYAVATALRIV